MGARADTPTARSICANPDSDPFLSLRAARIRRRLRPIHRWQDTSQLGWNTRASGKERMVLTRYARNNRLTDALFQQAFAALTLARRPCLYDKLARPRHRP